MMTRKRTRLIPCAEAVERLGKLPEATKVDRQRVEKYFGRFVESLHVYPELPPVQWLEGPHDYQHVLLDQGIYWQDARKLVERLSEWLRNIERAIDWWSHTNIAAPPELLITRTMSDLAPSGVTSNLPRNSLYSDHNYLRAIEAGLGFWIVTKATIVLFPRPVLRFFDETHTRRVLHSTLAPAVEYPTHPQSNEYWYRGTRVPAFVIANPERITLAHIRAARTIQVRNAMIDRYGLLRYAAERGYKPVDTDAENGCILWVKGGKRSNWNGISERHCILEMINATPEPDGDKRHFARRVDRNCATAREAVAWTFQLQPHEYHPDRQT